MRLTFQVPDIIIDNTKSEQLVELITKASQSMDISGSVLRSQGGGDLEVYNLSDLTSSLIHAVSASKPLYVNTSNPLRPVVYIGEVISAVSGGTGHGTLVSGTILVADSTSSYAQTSGSTFLNNHLAAGGNIGLSVVGDRVSIALSSSLTGLGSVSASSFTGSGAALTNLTASQVGGLFQYIQNSIVGSGSINIDNNGTASLKPDVTASNYSASGYFYGDGSKLTNIDAVSIAGVVRHISAASPLSASIDANGTGSIALMSQSVNYNGVTVTLGNSGSIPLVKNIIAGSNNITASSSSLSGAVTINLATRLQNLTDVSASYFTGSFKGDGSELTGLISSIYTTGSITGSGLTEGNAIRLKDIIVVTGITSSDAYITNNLTVAGTASIGVLNYVSGTQVNFGDKYIVILSGASDHTSLDGSGIQWGSGSSGDTYDNLGSHAHLRFVNSSNSLEIYPRLTTEHITASYISGGYIQSGYFSGSYHGDGAGITGVVADSVGDGAKYALTGAVNIFTTDQVVSGTLYVSSSVSASSFTGSGEGLYITASQITGLQQYIYNSITGSGSITVSSGTASLNATASVSVLTASSHVSASKYYGDGSTLSGIQASANVSGNLTGSGTTSDPFVLKDSVTLIGDITASYVTASHVIASYVTASYFYGNGNEIIGIKAENIINTLQVEHGGTGLSTLTSGALYIASGTGSLQPFTGTDSQTIGWDRVNNRWIATDTYPKTTYIVSNSVFSVGHIVALSGALVLADKSDLKKSNTIGVVSFVSGTTAVVQTAGEAYVSGASVYTIIGDEIWVGAAGVAANYASIGSGNYATRLGYINRAGGYVMLQINPVYKLA